MSTLDDWVQIAPCLAADAGLSSNGRLLAETSGALDDSAVATSARAWVVAGLFADMEAAFSSGADPLPLVQQALNRATKFLASVPAWDLGDSIPDPTREVGALPATGEHYGRLFEAFSADAYFGEAARLLQVRFERNDVSAERVEGAKALDAGCGGGRYSVALRTLGAASVTGVDASAVGVEDARRRVADAGIDGVDLVEGTVLDLDFEDSTFDLVFSNGVLHHTADWRSGVAELVRVLRPGGLGWLYLIENPGGLFWDVIEILRVVMLDRSRPQARRALGALGLPGNRIFYVLDHVMVPINVRLTAEEITGALESAGAGEIRRLTRGADFDRVEAITTGRPYAQSCYGVGEHRFTFSK